MNLTHEELRIIRHALGLDQSKVSYRNRYIATMASEAHEICIGLTRRGLMSCYETSPSFVCYHVTPAGIAAAQAGEVAKPKQCTWTEQEDGEYWETSCGNAFTFSAEGPKENGMRYCCYCGAELVEKKFVADDNDGGVEK